MRAIGLTAMVLAAFAMVALAPVKAEAGDVGKAKRALTSAKDNAQSERWDDLDTNMKKAATEMNGLSDAEKAPLLATVAEIKALVTKSVEDDVTKRLDRAAKADPGMGKLDLQRAEMRLKSDEAVNYADAAALEKLRARLAGMTGEAPIKTTPKVDPPTTTTPPKAGMSDDMQTATSRLRTARIMLEQGDPNIAEGLVRQAIKVSMNVPEAEKAGLMADLAKLTDQINEAQLKAQKAEEFRRIDERVGRYVRTAETSIQDGLVSDADWIDKSEALLATHDAKMYMEPAYIAKYQARLDETRKKLRLHNIKTSIERSADILKELETRVAADPFKGADQQAAHRTFTDLQTLQNRVLAEFARVPHEEPEIKAVLDRVAAANSKIEAASGKWAIEKMQERFAETWKYSSKPFEGWEAEKLAADEAGKGRVEGLGKTAQAVRGTLYWMNGAETRQVAEKYKDNPVVAETVKTAQKTLDAASAKLNEGFNAVMAAIEAKPMPERSADQYVALSLSHEAKDLFAGTKYVEANVARATALDAKWKAEIARIEKERAETLKRMTGEATAAWAKIDATVDAATFDPSDAERLKGKTVKIKGYWNRMGWDFDAAQDFAVDIKGTPVAGNYAPHVRAAFNDAQQKSHYGIDDHTNWDLICVVDGPGQVKRRVTTEWKDANTRQVIMKTESYVAEPCVKITVIGMRAGPLAVGPK